MSTRSAAQQALNKINTQLSEVKIKLDQLDPGLLNSKPSPEKWSVVQVLHHLFIVEQLTYKYLIYKIENKATFSRQRLSTTLKMYLYFFTLRLPLKFKAPQAVSQPNNDIHYDELMTNYHDLRSNFEAFMVERSDDFFNKASCKHTLIGRLTLNNMFRFFYVHFKHHHNQIFKTLIQIA